MGFKLEYKYSNIIEFYNYFTCITGNKKTNRSRYSQSQLISSQIQAKTNKKVLKTENKQKNKIMQSERTKDELGLCQSTKSISMH